MKMYKFGEFLIKKFSFRLLQFMWQFALLAIGCVPVMGFATSMHMQQMLGEDQGDVENSSDGTNSPGGVIVETLLNIRTVSALTLEKERLKDYERALVHDDPNMVKDALKGGITSGLSMFIQRECTLFARN
jgi:ATP-binding cassette, subfamily B (MDR/TAP), member 1